MFDTGNEQERSPKELITDLYKAFESFRRKMEDPSYIQIEGAIKQLMENQIEMKNSISDLKQKLLNPYDGIVVETKKNTEYRLEQKSIEDDMQKIIDEHRELMQWKSTITKLFWAILTGLGGLATFLVTQFIEHNK
jgi:predicted RNase H-like nuclease (RuvC/YqgF family)